MLYSCTETHLLRTCAARLLPSTRPGLLRARLLRTRLLSAPYSEPLLPSSSPGPTMLLLADAAT